MCVALTCGRFAMWRKRTESGAEPKWNAPRRKTPSTGPTIGRPSAVAVASAEQDHPLEALGDLLGGQPVLGGVDAQEMRAGLGVAAVEEVLERGEVLGRLVHRPG